MATKRRPFTVQVVDGKWYRLAHGKEPFYEECCDCSLVHRVRYKVEKGIIWQQWIVDDELTAEARRKPK